MGPGTVSEHPWTVWKEPIAQTPRQNANERNLSGPGRFSSLLVPHHLPTKPLVFCFPGTRELGKSIPSSSQWLMELPRFAMAAGSSPLGASSGCPGPTAESGLQLRQLSVHLSAKLDKGSPRENNWPFQKVAGSTRGPTPNLLHLTPLTDRQNSKPKTCCLSRDYSSVPRPGQWPHFHKNPARSTGLSGTAAPARRASLPPLAWRGRGHGSNWQSLYSIRCPDCQSHPICPIALANRESRIAFSPGSLQPGHCKLEANLWEKPQLFGEFRVNFPQLRSISTLPSQPI